MIDIVDDNFNPRSYKRSDPDFLSRINCPCEFQSTLLQEERRHLQPARQEHSEFQSTLLQEERLAFFQCTLFLLDISIHAPTRGATWLRYSSKCDALFQSTLLQEERRTRALPNIRQHWFQSTLLQEERQAEWEWYIVLFTISIHAPTRGATSIANLSRLSMIFYFNPRSYKRSDPWQMGENTVRIYFNPRSYKRSDYRV